MPPRCGQQTFSARIIPVSQPAKIAGVTPGEPADQSGAVRLTKQIPGLLVLCQFKAGFTKESFADRVEDELLLEMPALFAAMVGRFDVYAARLVHDPHPFCG
jgi:hypothetical protein